MKNKYRRLLRIFLLFAFVYLMLCPYASLLSAAHGGNTLIQQDDFRKTKKLVKADSNLSQNQVFLSSNSLLFIPSEIQHKQQIVGFFHRSIALTITSTAQLLL
jgi:hypothetical protein